MVELKWPVVECEGCGYNLREATPKASEKSNDVNGKLKWSDFCPKCGRGYFVGDRILPVPTAEVLAEREAQTISQTKTEDVDVDPEHLVTAGAVTIGEPSGVPPDKRGAALAEENPDPENLINQAESPTSAEGKPEPDAIRPPGEGEYFCTKCASNHKETSGVGKRHNKYREA